jgi:CTP:molybdopterin cytidylyltransferase MocA
VDAPLFSSETVKLLLESKASVCIPVFNKTSGHPIILDSKIIDGILTYSGSGGLKGAIAGFSSETEYVVVNDPGILYDMNTREDYSRILNLR